MVKPVLTKEQVLAQHEKNIADERYVINQRLQNLENQIQLLKKTIDDLAAQKTTLVSHLAAYSSQVEDNLTSHFSQVSREIDEIQKNVVFGLKNFNTELTSVKQLYTEKSVFETALHDLNAEIESLKKSHEKTRRGLKSSYDSAVANLDSKLEEFKKLILEAPIPELDQLPALHQKIAEHQVDKNGILDELRDLKRQVFYQSKYIEQLQTDVKKCLNQAH